MSRPSRAEQMASAAGLQCHECGSREIACEREAILVAPVAELREGVLILAGPPVPQPLDDVSLVCAECAAELNGAAWSSERPRGVPRGRHPITDAETLDALAAELTEPGDWHAADVCELAADLLRCTGRSVDGEPS